MLKLKHLAVAAAASALLAASAQASLVAGWDFSQYESGGGVLATDGNGMLANTLSANYSSLDPTFGAGAESAQYGTLYLNGSFGSSNVTNPLTGSIRPIDQSLASNLNASSPNPFDSHTILAFEGQTFTEFLKMSAFAPASIVFNADVGAGKQGTNWNLSFAAQLLPGVTGSVLIEVSTDGSAYTSLGSTALSTVDTGYSVNLGSAASRAAFVRLTFGAGATFDNVALSSTIVAPEPMTASLLAAGLTGLAVIGRRRR